MPLNENFLQELKYKTDIEDIISTYVTLRKRGNTSVGLCPFHNEKTPSFTVYNDTQSFYCFGCGAGGDAIGFIKKIENLDYIDAVKMLAERAKPFPSGTIGLFARKARCAECGYTLRSSKTKGKYYLQCPNHHISKESCRGAFISVERLERMVLQELHTISDAYLNWDELERQLDFCSHLWSDLISGRISI